MREFDKYDEMDIDPSVVKLMRHLSLPRSQRLLHQAGAYLVEGLAQVPLSIHLISPITPYLGEESE